MPAALEAIHADRRHTERQTPKDYHRRPAVTAIAGILLTLASLTGCGSGTEHPSPAPDAPTSATTVACAIPCNSTGEIDPAWLAKVELSLRRLIAAQLHTSGRR